MTGISTNRDSQVPPDSAVSPDALPTEAEVMAGDLESAAAPAEGIDDDRERRIREAAYAAYERRGGAPGNEIDDWLEGERSVDSDGPGKTPD